MGSNIPLEGTIYNYPVIIFAILIETISPCLILKIDWMLLYMRSLVMGPI